MPFCYGQFEIVLDFNGAPVELGSGAMATTYRAHDSVLDCDVALKVINRQIAQQPATRARFLREARAAAKLHHPNAASVSHYGEQDGECYYAMELVEGETLEARVQRDGPLSAPLALEIAIRVAHALTAAETHKVVHRDLKPSNIMITAPEIAAQESRGPTVKVIDWGLAKAVGAEAALSADCTFGGFVGTPAFASPEQFVAEGQQRLDTRSDIYALGITLWYLVCGRTPFVGTTLEEVQQKRVERSLPLEQLAPAVPAPLIALLCTMLAVDPAARPQSARELLAALEDCKSALRLRQLWKRGRRWLAVAAALGFLFLVGELIREGANRESLARAAADRSIAVLPFANLSGDQADEFLAAGMQDEINSELALVAQLKVIGAESAANYPPGNRDFPKITRELGVRYLLEGSVQRVGAKARVAITLVDPRDRKNDWRKSYEGGEAERFAVQRQITGDVLDRLRATLSGKERMSLDEPPTKDRLAYDLYLRSRQGTSMYKGPKEMLAGDNKKLALLNEAVGRDPNFAFAYCEIAGLHDGLEEIRADLSADDRSVDHRALAEMALERARRLKPDDGRLHLAQANHLYTVVGDSQQARIEAELARRTLPNNSALEELIARIAREDGEWEESLAAGRRAVELQPRDPGSIENLVFFYRALRRYEEADAASERLLALEHEGVNFFERLFRAGGFLEGFADLAPLRAAVGAAAPSDRREAAILQAYRLLLALCARDPSEIEAALAPNVRPRIILHSSTYPKPWFQALACRLRGDEEGAQKAFAAARGDMELVVQANPTDARALSILAMIDAGLGRADQAVREGEHAREIGTSEKSAVSGPVLGCNLAVVYAWTNQPDRAIRLLEDLASHGAAAALMFQPTYGDLRLNPIWDPLRKKPRFEALIKRLAPHSVMHPSVAG